MKTNLFYAALASVMLVGCTSNDFVGDTPPSTVQNANEAAIHFNSGTTALTRADLYGSAAAAKLGNKFVVYGTKHASAEDKTATNDKVVFNNFQVGYQASTAGTTESNSSDWEYVGKQAYDATPTSQAIKYWDYSADNGYTFYAFSSTDISYPKNDADNVQVTKVTADASDPGSLYNKGYSVLVKPAATLNNLYFSDRLEVPESKYGNTVSLTFRNIGAKVRFGFYETVPGYKVTIDKFYIDDANSAVVTDFKKMNDGQDDGFYASIQNVKQSVNQTINVTYYESTTATQVINRPKVSNPTGGYNYYIKLGSASTIINQELSTSAATPTWVTADNPSTAGINEEFNPVYPFEGNTNPLLLKLDFTLTSEDGNGDVIKVRGARAIVPAAYVQWKGNFAYTYIFKISDKSNGTTGAVDADDEPTDPEGLKPITFDAIVVDVTDELQETITSVSTNSITTYAEGAIVDEYNKNEAIYVAITDNSVDSHPVITPTAIGTAATQAQVYSLSKAATEAEVLAILNGSPISDLTKSVVSASIESTVPLVDGTTPSIANVKFTPSAAGYYAYVYTRTAYVAPTYADASGSYDSGTTYYMQNSAGVYYVVSVPNAAAYADNITNLKVRATPGTVGVYDVKIIKVQ
jgi:hypothetical protein